MEYEDDPYFQNITEEDEGPQHQNVYDAVFRVRDGKAALAIKEQLIGIPNLLQWDVGGGMMTIILMDGSTVNVTSPVPPEDIEQLRQIERVHLTTLVENNEFIVHHVPFSIQDY